MGQDMTKIGYTRVSTTDQTTDRQELGDIRIFEDKASGKNTDLGLELPVDPKAVNAGLKLHHWPERKYIR